jgi:hypothetical protein
MAWSAPMTAVSGEAFDADDFNTYVRDNLNCTMPALATGNDFPAWFVATGTNALAKRDIKSAEITVSGGQTTTSTSYTNLSTTGPSVSITTGTRALVMISCLMETNSTNTAAMASFDVTGASSISADDDWSIWIDGLTANNPLRKGNSHLLTNLTPGTNIFTMKYRVGSNTGRFNERTIVVWAM